MLTHDGTGSAKHGANMARHGFSHSAGWMISWRGKIDVFHEWEWTRAHFGSDEKTTVLKARALILNPALKFAANIRFFK